MIRNILKYSILFGLIFGAISCDKLIYDDLDEKPDAEAKVYLAVTRAAHVDGNESINKDELTLKTEFTIWQCLFLTMLVVIS